MSVGGGWLLSEKLQRSQERLESTELPITFVADQVGFANATSLRMHFKKRFNVPPMNGEKHFMASGKKNRNPCGGFT
jgi:transcriptional regulator GlxA family with amidase domain